MMRMEGKLPGLPMNFYDQKLPEDRSPQPDPE